MAKGIHFKITHMGLFDFLFNSKKKEQERLRLEKQERRLRLEQERIAQERERRLEENRRKERERQEHLKAEKEQAESMQPFTFQSFCHQRYENGSPVQGLQECPRTVSVVKNTNGCPGYRLQPGIGYIVKIYNDDLGKPNMSDKPMKVVRKTDDRVELRGFPIEAQSPFGWQEVDYSDYGFIVHYKNGQIDKCVLHMYDRNIRIEYMKKAATSKVASQAEKPSGRVSKGSTNPPESEVLVNKAMRELAAGNDGDAVYHPLFKAWRSFQSNPEQLKQIVDFGRYGLGLMVFLSYGTVSDIDDKQQLASVSYLFLSKAIQGAPHDINLYKNRLILMITNHEAFEYTVSSVVNKGKDFMSMSLSPLKARDAMFKMEFADLSRSPQLMNIGIIADRYIDLKNKISNGFFGPGQDMDKIREQGNGFHQEILEYLENKVIVDRDIDF